MMLKARLTVMKTMRKKNTTKQMTKIFSMKMTISRIQRKISKTASGRFFTDVCNASEARVILRVEKNAASYWKHKNKITRRYENCRQPFYIFSLKTK